MAGGRTSACKRGESLGYSWGNFSSHHNHHPKPSCEERESTPETRIPWPAPCSPSASLGKHHYPSERGKPFTCPPAHSSILSLPGGLGTGIAQLGQGSGLQACLLPVSCRHIAVQGVEADLLMPSLGFSWALPCGWFGEDPEELLKLHFGCGSL